MVELDGGHGGWLGWMVIVNGWVGWWSWRMVGLDDGGHGGWLTSRSQSFNNSTVTMLVQDIYMHHNSHANLIFIRSWHLMLVCHLISGLILA